MLIYRCSLKYGNICGYTQADIETSFQPYMEDWSISIDEEQLIAFDIEHTVFYLLKIPNLKVRSSFNNAIVSMLTDSGSDSNLIGSMLYCDMLLVLRERK